MAARKPMVMGAGGPQEIPSNDAIGLAQGGTGATTAAGAIAAFGLGGAATLSVGTVEGTVAAGDDSRITGALQTSALSSASVTATGATASRTLAARSADALSLLDFKNSDGSAIDLTGTKDISFALSAALALGDVRLPNGTLLLASTVTVPDGRMIFGATWSEVGPTGAGSWIKITSTGFNPITSGGRLVMRSVGFFQTQPAPSTTFTPTAYPAIITSAGGSLDVADLFFWGCTQGILLTESAGGGGSYRHRIHNLRGQTFGPMVTADVVTDTMDVDRIHHWPHYTFSAANGFTTAQQNAMVQYQVDNVDVVLSRRNDNSFISRVFGYAVRSAIHCDAKTGAISTANNGPTAIGSFQSIQADGGKFCVLVTGVNTTFVLIHGYMQGLNPAASGAIIPHSACVMIDDAALDGAGTGVTGCVATLIACESSSTDYGLVKNFGASNTINIVNPIVRAWNGLGNGHAAIEGNGGTSSNVVTVSNPTYLVPPSSPVMTNSVAGDLTYSGDSGATYVTAEGTNANYNIVFTPKGTGALISATSIIATYNVSGLAFYENGTALSSKYLPQAGGIITGALSITGGALSQSSGNNAVAGDAVSNTYTLRAQTTNTAPTRLTTTGGAVTTGGANSVPVPLGATMALHVDIVGHDTANPANCGVWTVPVCAAVRDGTNPPYFPTNTTTAVFTSGTASSATITVAGDTTNNCLAVTVTAPNADLWQWVATVRSTEAR